MLRGPADGDHQQGPRQHRPFYNVSSTTGAGRTGRPCGRVARLCPTNVIATSSRAMVPDIRVAMLLAMIAKVTLFLCGSASMMFGADAPIVLFSNDFREFYPAVIDASAGSLNDLPQEPAIAVASPHQIWNATITRTDGAKVPYDNSLGRIEVKSDGQPMTVIRIHGFRTVTVKWVNDRLLHIGLGLGHIAGVDAIYDTKDHRWVYQDSVSYPPRLEQR